MKHLISKTMTAVPVLALALAVGGCGSSSDDDDMAMMPTPQEVCEDANGRWNADMTCTSAEELAAEAAAARAAMQRTAISTAITAAQTAVNAVNDDSTDAQVSAAETAIAAARTAIADAADVPANEKAANTGTVDALSTQLATAKSDRDTAMDDAAEEAKMEMAAMGKALKGALTSTPLDWLGGDIDTTTTGEQISTLGSSGLQVNISDRAATPAFTASPTMKAGASAGSLGSWAGTNYAHKNAGTGVSNSAIVYTNRAAAKTYPIASRYATAANVPSGAGTYTPADRMLAIADDTADANIKADMFPTAGTTTFTPTAPSNENLVRGTYQGAAGSYRCTGTCTATATATGISLSDAWVFVHDTGAMVSISDSNYLYFGWWLRKDKDDEPTAASAFTGVVGTAIEGSGATALGINPNALAGKATYNGHAAGKFAISDPIDGGDAGHFTADAMLTATFGSGATAGLTGTLDNFMANEQSVPWSVSLLRAAWDGTTAGATAPVDDPDTSAVNEATDMTVWSIDGNSAAADGTWSAQMYDEKPGAAPSGDGSNVPTSVTGMFQSHFGSSHTMVGAFGATQE